MKKLFALLLICATPVLADIPVTPGSGGKTVQTDTVNSKEIQLIKLTNGAIGSSTTVTIDPVVGMTVNLGTSTFFPGAIPVVTTNTWPVSLTNPSAGVFTVTNSTNPLLIQSTNTLKVDGSGVTQPVSGTFWQATQPVSVATPYGVILTTVGANSSTAAVVNAVGTTLAISGSISNTGFNVNNTPAVTQSGTWSVGINNPSLGVYNVTNSTNPLLVQSTGPFITTLANPASGVYTVANSTNPLLFQSTATIPVSVATPYTVIQTTVGANSSTEAVVNAVGTTLAISGSISNTGFNVNNTPAVTQSGTWTVGINNPSLGVYTVTNSTNPLLTQSTAALPSGTNTIGNVNIVNPSLGVFTITNSTNPLLFQSTSAIPISGTINANMVDVSTAAFAGPITSTGTMIAGVGPNGKAIAFAVDASSSAFVVMENPSLGVYTITNSTNPLLIQTTSAITVAGNNSNNGAASGADRITTLPGIFAADYPSAANTPARNAAGVFLSTSGLLAVSALPDNTLRSYSASTNTISVASTATDFTGLCGNANNTVYLYNLRLSCTETTAGNATVSIFKRSSADTGAFSTMTAVAQDSNYQIVQSTAVFFTANPTLGTLVGHLDNYKLACMASATATPNDIYISPSSWRMKPIVLRGAAQCVYANLESQTVTGGSYTATWEWIESRP